MAFSRYVANAISSVSKATQFNLTWVALLIQHSSGCLASPEHTSL